MGESMSWNAGERGLGEEGGVAEKSEKEIPGEESISVLMERNIEWPSSKWIRFSAAR